MLKTFRAATILALVSLALPQHATAALTWAGVSKSNTGGRPGSIVADDVAYDEKHDVYLHVWESDRTIMGCFIGSDGTPRGTPFAIPGTYIQTWAGAPRVVYSSNGADDVFFVGFSSDYSLPDRGKNVFGRMVRYTGTGPTGATFVGGDFPVSPFSGTSSVRQTMNDIAYNPVQRQFFVLWDDSRGGTEVFGRMFDANGTAINAEFNISNAPWSQGAASVAYDNEHNRYLVVYQGLHPNSPANPEILGIWAKMVDGASGTVISGLIELTRGGSLEPNVVYLPQQDAFLGYWTGFASDGRHVFGRQVPFNYPESPRFVTGVYPVMSSAGEGGADGAYNPRTNTTLLTSMFVNSRVRGAELGGDGNIITASFTISTIVPGASGAGSYWPRVAAGPNGQFGFGYTVDFTHAWLERYNGTVVDGNPTPTPAPVPAPPAAAPVSNPLFVVDTPTNNATLLGSGFLISGWAVDTGATSSTGIDVVVCWAFPTNGAPAILAGIASYGHPRPDVGAWLGGKFGNSGYGLMGVLPAGQYTLSVYTHSTVSGLWGTPKTLTANVITPVSTPRMWMDTPTHNMIVPTTFGIAGWALDLGAGAGTGVDTVHVWAHPTSGAAPIFLGVAQYGFGRPDVASFFGSSWKTNSGWGLVATLPVGDYTVVAYAHSSVAGTFNNTAAALVRVR